MDNTYVQGLKTQKRSTVKKLYMTICMCMVVIVLVTATSYAWLVMSRAPEVSEVTTTLSANGSLEIALNTNSIQADEYTANEAPVANLSSAFEKNPYWGNVVDLADQRYGLQKMILKPAALNEKTGSGAVNTESPFGLAQYGNDGRITTLRNADQLASYDAASRTFVSSVNHGVRAVSESAEVFAFGIDLLLQTNADEANLLLQTKGLDRIYNQNNAPENWNYSDNFEEVQGEGSKITMRNQKLLTAVRVVFADTATGQIYGVAQADRRGYLYLVDAGETPVVCPMTRNKIVAITAWVYLDGEVVDNLDADVTANTNMDVNLQFTTDVALNPAYSGDTVTPNGG